MDLTDPYIIHKLRLIELSEKTNLVDFEDYKSKIANSDENSVNILYVVDMQNDFIKPDGAFAVHGGNSVTDNIDIFIRDNQDKFEKIIFSRDYHEKNHCGFFIGNTGMHPPHCIQTESGAAFDDKIKNLLSDVLLNTEGNEDYNKTEIVFKAMEMESFGASKAMNKDGKWYNIHSNSCKVKCNNDANCLNLTGGFKPDSKYKKTMSIENNFTTNELNVKYDIQDILNEIHEKDSENISKRHNIYVTGLAGCHCVSETAINIADYLSSSKPEIDYQIYIIEDLTRYAFVPLFITDFSQDNDSFSMENILKRQSKFKNQDDLSYYIFEITHNSQFKLLSREEVTSKADEIASSVKKSEAKYFHYLAPLNKTINKYKQYKTKIKLLMSPSDKLLPSQLRKNQQVTHVSHVSQVSRFNPSLFGSPPSDRKHRLDHGRIGGKKKSKKNRIATKRRRQPKKRKYTKKRR